MDSSGELNTNDSSINAEVFKGALPSIFQRCSNKELLTFRRVCKQWDEIVQKDGRANSYVFKLTDNPTSMEAFKNLSFPVKQFNFEHMDLEKELFQNQEIFRRFTMKHCLAMIYLSINDCNLPTGRFFELLAFCGKLRNLVIKDTPSIFAVRAGIGIVHWGFCFNRVRKNLGNLQKLFITEKMLRHNDVRGLAIGIQNLKCLQIGCSFNLPMDGINEVLKNSCNSLNMLVLRGAILPPGLDIGAQCEMKSLQKLVLMRAKIDDRTLKQLDAFLAKCPALTEFHMSHGQIQKGTLSRIMTNLVSLNLVDCCLDANTFEDAQFPKLQTLKMHIQHPPNDDVEGKVEKAMTGFAKCGKPKLSTLELQLVKNGAQYLKYLNVATCKQLTSLSLSNSVDVAGIHLRAIFRELTSLLSLSFANCHELTDENVCSVPAKDPNESLANLKNLKSLNLSKTNVGNKTVVECIVRMAQLEKLVLDNTKVNEKDLCIIAIACTGQGGDLRSLKAVSASHCKFSTSSYRTLIRGVPNVDFNCAVDT